MFSYLSDYIDDDKLKGLEISGIVFNDLKTYSAAINNIHVFDYLGISYIPFPCPDSLVSMVADFIMSLKEIQVAVVYNVRPDGLKFSVRSEKREVDAGVLVSAALAGASPRPSTKGMPQRAQSSRQNSASRSASEPRMPW